MFINANPRIVSNGCFETFVPYQRSDLSVHQGLEEMTNNHVNAWSVFRPVSAAVDGWDDQGVDFGNDENFANQSLYGRQYQENYSRQLENFSFAKSMSYKGSSPGQADTKPSTVQQAYQSQAPTMNCVDNSPMLGNDYAEWSLGRGRGSFAEFLKTTNAAKKLHCQSSEDMSTTAFTAASSIPASISSYTTMASPPVGDTFGLDNRMSPSSTYGSYSSTDNSVELNEMMHFETPTMDANMSKIDWWQSVPRNYKDQYHSDFDPLVSHDGLPQYTIQQQDDEIWNMGTGTCGSLVMTPRTISPREVLKLEAPLAMSTSGSSQGTAPNSSDSSAGRNSKSNTEDYSGSERMTTIDLPIPYRRQRQMLPAEPAITRRHVPVVPSNDFPSGKHHRRSSVKTKTTTKHAQASKNFFSSPSSSADDLPAPKASSPKKIEPKPTKTTARNTWGISPKQVPAEQATLHRSEKDTFLINSKLAGMSYKEIRRKGKFTEAESTLRGRFRTLTKHKAARVRKPEWDQNDIRLLKKAVRKLTHDSDTAKGKIPWKQVAEYIANNGGSYHFGNATCRKRWDELQGTQRMVGEGS